MDFEQARFNMIEQQIRPWDVLDLRVLALLAEIRREEFVAAAQRELAFADLELPIGFGQSMWAPKLEARVLQELELRAADRVLEVGSGSGYLTALLARSCAHVTSVEVVPELSAFASANLARASVDNVRLRVGDAARGWSDGAPYDAIVLTGSTPVLAPEFFDFLAPGGKLFAVVGDAPVMVARLYQGVASGISERDLFETQIGPLRNAPAPARFRF
jgi:protein-L-isoaspartate(D-aspartate) O-methyltransferase